MNDGQPGQPEGTPPGEETAGNRPSDEKFRDLAELEQEIRRRLRSNQRFLERFLDEDFVDDEGGDEEADDRDDEEL